MRASTKRILSILLSGVFLVGLIVVSTTLISPEFETVQQKRALLFSKQNLYQNQTNAVDEVQNLISQFQSFDQLQNTISLAMPISEQNTSILAQLTAITRNASVQIEGFEIYPNAFEESNQALTKRLGSLEVSINVSGFYQNIKNFISLLETNVRVFNILDLNITPTSEGGSFVDAVITFNAFFQEG